MKERACKNCQALSTGSVCPQCKSTSLTVDYTGIVIILDPENSMLAKRLNINKPGRYAMKVR
ncbi:MAG: transcription elongation factor subunit Spt4 [Candidatus Ranarchaeia archaeon]